MGPSHGVFDPKSIFLLFTSSCGGHEFKKLLLRARERGGIVSSHPVWLRASFSCILLRLQATSSG